MERVARRVNAHESQAFVDGVQQLLLALGGHRWFTVGTESREVSRGEKNDGGIFMELCVVENAGVFRHAYVESVLVAEGGHGIVDDAGLAVDALYNVVLEARGLCEDQHGFLCRG